MARFPLPLFVRAFRLPLLVGLLVLGGLPAVGWTGDAAAQTVLSVNTTSDLSASIDALDDPDTRSFVRLATQHTNVLVEGGSTEARVVALFVQSGTVIGSRVSEPVAAKFGQYYTTSELIPDGFASSVHAGLRTATGHPDNPAPLESIANVPVSNFYDAVQFFRSDGPPPRVPARLFAGQRLSGTRIGVLFVVVPEDKMARARADVLPAAFVVEGTPPPVATTPASDDASTDASDDAAPSSSTSSGDASSDDVESVPASSPTAATLDVRYNDLAGSVPDGTTLDDLPRVLGRHGEVIAEGGSVEAQLVALGVQVGGTVVGSAVSDPLQLSAGLRDPADFFTPRFSSQLVTELASALGAPASDVRVRGVQQVSVSGFSPSTDFLAGSRLPNEVNPRFFAGQRLSSASRLGLVLVAVPTGKTAQATVRVHPTALVLDVTTSSTVAQDGNDTAAPSAPTGPARLDLSIAENASLAGSVASSTSDVVTQLRRNCELLVGGGSRDVQIVALGVQVGGDVVSSAVSDPISVGDGLQGLSGVFPSGFASMVQMAIAEATAMGADVPQRIKPLAVQDTYAGDAFLAGNRIPDAVDAQVFAGQQLSNAQRTGLVLAVIPADEADRPHADVRPLAFVLEAQPF